MKWLRASVLFVGLGMLRPDGHIAPPLVVHEWGTITTRHAADGTPEGRLNRIDSSEVLPAFVHRYEPPATRGDTQRSLTKTTLTPGRPDVTMRLETPVIYFYPTAGARTPPFDVAVRFRGGILNEFYPVADGSVDVDVERVAAKMRAGLLHDWDGAVLDNYVVGGLRWRGLALKPTVSLPSTDSHVWLAPRRVRAAGVTAATGESERYLFYRGVAHLDAVLQTRRTTGEIQLLAPARLHWLRAPSMTVSRVWLLHTRVDGHSAFRERTALIVTRNHPSAELARISLFADSEYSTTGLAELRRSMKRALTGAGLFDDEAEAMLETWRESYFRAPGLRVLYLVPNEWTSHFLPFEVSVPTRLTRVLIGRIDLLDR
jgi:hypothetical protein